MGGASLPGALWARAGGDPIMSRLIVMPHKKARSWPQLREDKPIRPGDRCAHVRSIARVMEHTYRTDAHFAAYVSPNGYRLNRRCFDEGISVEMTAAVFDVDAPGHEATPQWRREIRERVCALADVHPGLYMYETRGGLRILYTLPGRTILRSREDADRWRQQYLTGLAYLSRRFGIEADPACSDWQRLYRCPRATRDPGGDPENHPTWGDPSEIQPLRIDATWSDLDLARSRARKAFQRATVLDVTPCPSSGDGLFYRLLRARGDILEEHDRGAYVIRCPAEREHTTGQTGDGSTLLYLPAAGMELGAIHCLHAHCSGRTAREWLRFFSDDEIESARRSPHAA